MKSVLYLLTVLALLGGFDTLYYHEWRARLPALGRSARSELRLHAFRDFVYTVLFVGLPWLVWQGRFVLLLVALFLIEVVLTLWDFVVEDWIRKPLGGVYPGERIMHAVMGIVYGAMLAFVVPTMQIWWSRPTKLTLSPPLVAEPLRWFLVVIAVGVFLSGVRDLCAAAGLRGSAWPWAPALGPKSLQACFAAGKTKGARSTSEMSFAAHDSLAEPLHDFRNAPAAKEN